MGVLAGIAFAVILPLLTQATHDNVRESGMNDTEVGAIKRVIQHAYVDGVHTSQDIGKVRSGFHNEFRMMVLDRGSVKPVGVGNWLARVTVLKSVDPELWSQPTSVRFDLVDVTGRSAVAKMHVYKGEQFFSTDYMFLYRIGDEWTIVSKVFVTEPAP